MSFFTTVHTTNTIRPLPLNVLREDAIAFLHKPQNVVDLNPNLLSASEQASRPAFWTSESKNDQPADPAAAPVFDIVEREGGKNGPTKEGGLYDGIAKKLVGDEVKYTMGFRNTNDGTVSISHAMLGVWSRVTWIIRVAKDGEEGSEGVGKGLLVEERGEVKCNRALMVFVKPTLQQAHNKLVDSYIKTLSGSARSC